MKRATWYSFDQNNIPADIATTAKLAQAWFNTLVGISRSTFYAHYSGIDALLADSITGPFEVLADTIRPEFVESRLVGLLERFWENRRFARGILGGAGPA